MTGAAASPGGAEAARRSLSLLDKVFYAFASVGNSALFWAQSVWVLYFYAPPESADLPIRMPPALIGVALGVGRLIEVFDDPLIGWWSDRTRSRWGRRIPFIVLGTPILALSFWLIWFPPVEGESVLNLLYFFVIIELFYLARTVIEAPYDALQAEIATSSTDRVSLGAWKFFFGVVGVAVGLVLSPLLIGALGFGGMGLVLGITAAVAIVVTLAGLLTRPRLQPVIESSEVPPLIGSIRATLSHRAFLALGASFMLFNLGYQLLIADLPYYLRVTLGLGEAEVAYFSGGVAGLALLAVPALAWAARRWTKKALYAASMGALGVYLVFLAVGAFQPLLPGIGLFGQALALVSLSGLGFAGLFVLPGAMVADVIDDDSRRTGQGRAAVFYGVFKTLEKIAQSAAVVVLGFLLQAFGNTPEQPLGIRLAMPTAGVCVLLGFVTVFFWYRLREARREPTAAGG